MMGFGGIKLVSSVEVRIEILVAVMGAGGEK